MRSRSGLGLMFLAGTGVGACLMALIDPSRGATRRALLRGKAAHSIHISRRAGVKHFKRLKNRAVGSVSEVKARIFEHNIPDDILLERVRAQVGHVVADLHALGMQARAGHVTIWGPALRGERERIAHRLNDTRGVQSFYLQIEERDRMEERQEPEEVTTPTQQEAPRKIALVS